MALVLSSVQNTSGVGMFNIDSSNNVESVSGFQYNFINRGGSDPNADIEVLESFNDIHYYSVSGNVVYVRTRMIPDAMYELSYTSNGGSANIDFSLFPNGTSYGSQFLASYRAQTGSNNSFDQANQTTDYFYIDHQFGGAGVSPTGKVIIFSGVPQSLPAVSQRRIMYFGGDTAAIAWGYSRWAATSVWDWIGTLSFNGNNKRVWVRRIG